MLWRGWRDKVNCARGASANTILGIATTEKYNLHWSNLVDLRFCTLKPRTAGDRIVNGTGDFSGVGLDVI